MDYKWFSLSQFLIIFSNCEGIGFNFLFWWRNLQNYEHNIGTNEFIINF